LKTRRARNWPVIGTLLATMASTGFSISMLIMTESRHQAQLGGLIIAYPVMLALTIAFVYLLTILTRSSRTYWLKVVFLVSLTGILWISSVMGQTMAYLDWKDPPIIKEGIVAKVETHIPRKAKNYYDVIIWIEGTKEQFDKRILRVDYDEAPLYPGQVVTLEYSRRLHHVSELWYEN
jgi:hypothetical protein